MGDPCLLLRCVDAVGRSDRASLLVDGFHGIDRDGGAAVEDEGRIRETVLDFGNQIDPEALTTGLVSELDRAVAGADSDGEGVDSGPRDELLGLRWIGIDDFFQHASNACLGTTNRAELALDTDTPCMSDIDNRFGNRHIRSKSLGSSS